ncbi:MAG: DNA polymerase IV [Pseudomonadota bacterium]
MRTIMHIDMDAFFAAVEEVDNPELRGKPVIVGGSNRGVVSTASYEARKYGVHSAMPVFEARRRCPHGIFLPVRMERYREASCRIMDILKRISPLVEQVSIDEAFIDLEGTERLHGDCITVGEKIKQDVWAETSLTCSIGVAPNKFLAKIGSDMKKPDGFMIIRGEEVEAFLKDLPVGKLPGVGPKSKEVLERLGIVKASDIMRFPEELLENRLGRYGLRLRELAQGIDDSPVCPHSPVKSIGSECTLLEDTRDLSLLRKWLMSQAEEVGERLRSHDLRARTVTLKLKYNDFKMITRSRTLAETACATQVLFDAVADLLDRCALNRPVRLIGLSVSRLDNTVQYNLLSEAKHEEKLERTDKAIDQIRTRLGRNIIKRGTTVDFDY